MKRYYFLAWSIAWLSIGQLTYATTRLMVFGGGALPKSGMKYFVELSGGTQGKILVIPWASSTPLESCEAIHSAMAPFNPIEIGCAPDIESIKIQPEVFMSRLNSYSAIFFGGGNQNTLMDFLETVPKIEAAIVRRYQSGIVTGGTSAGLSIMSKTMLTGEADMTELDPSAVKTRRGLGLIEGVVLDQHFVRRNRIQRMLSVLLGSVERYAIGVDENTGIVVSNNHSIEVIGDRKAILFERHESPTTITLRILSPGENTLLAMRNDIGVADSNR